VPRPTPQPGTHFGVYYDLATSPVAAQQRPIPHVRTSSNSIDWQSVHPHDTLWSALLEKLRMEPGRGPYDVVLCPVGRTNGQ
jgi:hypothetical protein